MSPKFSTTFALSHTGTTASNRDADCAGRPSAEQSRRQGPDVVTCRAVPEWRREIEEGRDQT